MTREIKTKVQCVTCGRTNEIEGGPEQFDEDGPFCEKCYSPCLILEVTITEVGHVN